MAILTRKIQLKFDIVRKDLFYLIFIKVIINKKTSP